MAHTMLTVGFAGSPAVFILNAVVLEIPTKEQSEERASKGAEPRQASRDLITSVTASDGKPFQVSIFYSQFQREVESLTQGNGCPTLKDTIKTMRVT